MNTPLAYPAKVTATPLVPDWGHALRVWWSWQWRVTFLTLLVGISIRFLFVNLWLSMGFSREMIGWGNLVICCIASLLTSIYLFKDILNKSFSDFTVCIMPKDVLRK